MEARPDGIRTFTSAYHGCVKESLKLQCLPQSELRCSGLVCSLILGLFCVTEAPAQGVSAHTVRPRLSRGFRAVNVHL